MAGLGCRNVEQSSFGIAGNADNCHLAAADSHLTADGRVVTENQPSQRVVENDRTWPGEVAGRTRFEFRRMFDRRAAECRAP